MTLLDAVILTGQCAAALALVVALSARSVRTFAEARRTRRVLAADSWRRGLIRAAMSGTRVDTPRTHNDLVALQSAFAQASRRADPAFAERLRAATDGTGLEAFLIRRLGVSANARVRMEAAEALRWHAAGGEVLRRALMVDPLVQNRVAIARLLADRGERVPARVLGRALRLGSSSAAPAVHQALADADLVSDRALAHLEHSHRARSWLRITARAARRRRTPVGWPVSGSPGTLSGTLAGTLAGSPSQLPAGALAQAKAVSGLRTGASADRFRGAVPWT